MKDSEAVAEFKDLPLVIDDDDARHVHNTAGLFFLNNSRLTAHDALDCNEVGGFDRVVGNPRWRVATSNEVRALGAAGASGLLVDGTAPRKAVGYR